ncbi:helicase [Fragilaria crotonensis]|nr:helicase [Fragilaria crotonensis]
MAIARDGFTMHGLVKMNIEPDDKGRLQCKIGDQSQRAELIRGADYLIVEEGPNAHRRVWEALAAECRALRRNDRPFGGLRVISAGDFRQIPPPIRSHDERDIYNASVKSWPIWQDFDVVCLTEPIRTADDVLWTQACDNMGNGTTEPITPDKDGRWTSIGVSTWVDLPETVKAYDAKTSINEARDWVHPDVHDFDAVVNSALVAVTNKQVDDHNKYFLDKVLGEQRTMISADTILSELPTDVKCIVTDYTDTLTHNKVPPKKLIVKVNGIHMHAHNKFYKEDYEWHGAPCSCHQ